MIEFTSEMLRVSGQEAQKRDPYIKHHFEVGHLTSAQRDRIGFLGEFAFCKLMGVSWKENIRDNYLTIDTCDLELGLRKIDVKTETVPKYYAQKIINRIIHDDKAYGRRLFCQAQKTLLTHYDIVVFGVVIRENMNAWYPIGYIEASKIRENYSPTKNSPYGSTYPFAGYPIRTSDLKPISELMSK